MRRFLTAFTVTGVIFLFLIFSCPSNLFAGGSGVYPNGVEQFLIGAPPPGFTFINYSYYYYATKKKDDGGDNVADFDHLAVWADVLRFIMMTDYKIAGGNWGMQFFFPILHVDLDDGTFDDAETDVPYFIASLFIWHKVFMNGKLHLTLSLPDIYIPSNSDSGVKNDQGIETSLVGNNFWTFEPVVALTYISGNLEASIKFMYDFSTTQNDYLKGNGWSVDRDPGQEFHFDYGISYALQKNFRIGLGGYFYFQTTDDDFDFDGNVPAPLRQQLKDSEDDHTKKIAVGPGILYQYKNFIFTFKIEPEVYVRNAPKGVTSIFKFIGVF